MANKVATSKDADKYVLEDGKFVGGPMIDREFSARDLAREMLLWFKRDIPQTVILALTIILTNFIKTGKWTDDMGRLIGEQPVPPLRVQREDELKRALR